MVKVACDERDEDMMSMYGRSRGIQLNDATVVDWFTLICSNLLSGHLLSRCDCMLQAEWAPDE
jgi:hypothetical protein